MKKMWPSIQLYDKQVEAVYSFMNDAETVVPAGNQLGKDFIAGRLVLWYFQSRYPCRIVTTSAKDDHLRVLWGEIKNAIDTAAYPMDVVQGGNLIINQREIRRLWRGHECALSYVKGMVAGSDSIAAMQGHHIAKTGDGIPRTAIFCDESSSVPDTYYTMFSTWADRMFIFGNTWDCSNFFYKAVKGDRATGKPGGDIPRDNGNGYYRKVIKITAEDSPNVRLGLEQRRRGLPVTYEQVIPGVKNYEEYEKNLRMWDKIQICVSLHAEFYEGAEVRLFPQDWLDRAEEIGNRLVRSGLKAQTIGVDSAHGGDNTAWVVACKHALLALFSEKTPDTSIIPGRTLGLAHQYGVKSEDILFDAGGGGKEHADRLRSKGHLVRIVAFGEAPTNVNTFKRMKTSKEKVKEREERVVYKNRRAEMYGALRELLDPNNGPPEGFGIPSEIMNRVRSDGGPSLRNQLAPIPLTYDDEGRLYLLPKNRKPNAKDGDVVKSLTELVGCSPDEADAVVLALFGIMQKATRAVAGAVRLVR